MFREETAEILTIKEHLMLWSAEEWKIFSNNRFLMLPIIEYAFLLFDAGFNPETDSPKRAEELLYGKYLKNKSEINQ